jgi:hypothetical protein
MRRRLDCEGASLYLLCSPFVRKGCRLACLFVYLSVDGLGCGLDDQGIVLQFQVGKGGLLVSKEYGFALGPTQTPLQYILGALSRGVNAAGSWTWHSLPSTEAIAWNNILAPQYLWIVCTGIYYLYLYSCVFCIMMLSIDQTILHQMIEWLLDSELERLWFKIFCQNLSGGTVQYQN